MTGCSADLYWIPVGAGTSRFQQASLRWWEAFEATRARRPRTELLHSALKLRTGQGSAFTLELTPAFVSAPVEPIVTGAVGVRGADRLKLFRYALRCIPAETIPDEQWAVAGPIHLTGDCGVVQRILDLAPSVPRHVWGRRVRGTREMWTSDSVISWLLIQAGLDVSFAGPPPGGRAPGWDAGIALGRLQRLYGRT